MGLKLIEFSVENYRNLNIDKVKVNNKLSIVGINNIGKTNLIKLISYVLHPDRYPSNNEFFSKKENYSNPDKPIIVDLAFSVDEDIKQDGYFMKYFEDFIHQDKIFLKFERKWHGEANFYIAGSGDFYREYPEWVKQHRFRQFNAYFITTEKSYLDDFNLDNNNSLISDYLEFLKTYDYPKFEEFSDRNKLVDTLSNLNLKINLQRFFPQIKEYYFEFNSEENKLEIYINENGTNRSLNQMGSGLKKLFLLNIYFYFFEILKSSKGQMLLLIDEPEVNLHPSAQRSISELLNEISKNQQIIITTHSPYIIEDLFNIEDILLLKKDNNSNQTSGNQINITTLNEISEEKIISELNSIKKEIFFADKVIIVEGYSDYL